MQPKELFGVVVRTIGLLASIASVLALVEAIATQRGQPFIDSLVFALIGLLFILGASAIAEWCYEIKQTVNDEAESSNQPMQSDRPSADR
jgi:hypothetical protein